MNLDDHAIVIGIRRYPMFGENETLARDLDGPDRDAQAVYDWLVDPDKGGVPTANANLIRSACFPEPFPDLFEAAPHEQAIKLAFDKLEARKRADGTIGRRLYLYASGHGFGKGPAQAGLYMANATRSRTHNVNLTGWANVFAIGGYFKEVVLWADCCMTNDTAVTLQAPTFNVMPGIGGGGKLFTAFAAKFTLDAVELPMPDGERHGVFTYFLLQGLNGDAGIEETREITSDILRGYLIRAMNTLLNAKYPNDSAVSKDPDFGKVDHIVFREQAPVTKHPYTLAMPDNAAGQTIRIVTGALHTVESRQAQGASETFHLPTGVYVALIESLGWQHGFVIVGGAGG